MNKIQTKKRKTTLCTIMVFILMLMTVTSTVAYAADSSVSITVRQTYTTSSATVANSFAYILKPLKQDNPMPSGSASGGYTFSIAGNSTRLIGPMIFEREGLYRYELSQVISREIAGYQYDKRVYTIEIHVDELMKTTVIVKNESNEKEDALVFKNAYNTSGEVVNPPGTTPPTTTPPTTTTPPPPRPTVVPPPTTTPTGPTTGGSTPDVDLGRGDEDPDIPGDIDLPDAGDPEVNRPGPGVYGPKTGDESNTTFYMILFASGGLLVIGTIICLIIIGKRKRSSN